MQANYRAIFTEMLLAQSAAAGAFADAAGRYAQLTAQAYQEALLTLAAETQPKDKAAGPAHPVDGARISGASSAGFGRPLSWLRWPAAGFNDGISFAI